MDFPCFSVDFLGSNDPLGSNCLARSLDNPLEPPLRCPSTAELQNFTAAARKGEIAWNAVPFNIQPEPLGSSKTLKTRLEHH